MGLLFHASWYYEFPWGITPIYTYFQIPLMVLVFLPAIDGLKVQWREAVGEPGRVGVAVLAARRRAAAGAGLPRLPCCCCSRTRCRPSLRSSAWENQIAYIVPQQISTALSSEVGLSSVNVADLLALGMVIMVAIVMTGYALLQRRAARWLR